MDEDQDRRDGLAAVVGLVAFVFLLCIGMFLIAQFAQPNILV